MNTLKILSILIFAVACFATSLFIANRMLLNKKSENESTVYRLLSLSSVFVGLSIILNLVFQKINQLYDLIDQFGFDFQKLFSIGRFNYGFSPEMVKVSSIYLALAFLWVLICASLSRLLGSRIMHGSGWENNVLKNVIFICLAITFYPIFDFILDNFYIILNKPIIN